MASGDSRDLTTGSVGGKLIRFSMPIFATLLLQAVYSIVDMILVGQFLGATGMSAVSIGSQLSLLVLAMVNGLGNGCSVRIGNLHGQGHMEKASRTIGSFLSFVVLLAVCVTALILVFRAPILKVLDTPAESYEGAISYLTVTVLGTVFVYLYNACYGALRGIGESLFPMKVVLLTTVENIVLDWVFLRFTPMGTAGAALATVVSQATSAIFLMVYIRRKTALFDFHFRSFRMDGQALWSVLRVGLPQSVQFTLTNICFLMMITLVNGYGVTASAAAGAASKIMTFGLLSGHALMSGLVTLTAQNLPGAHYDRILKGMGFGILVCALISAVLFFFCQFFPGAMYGIFTSDPSVVEVGATYLRVYALCMFTENTMFCMFGVLTGAGYTTVTMVCALIMAFGVRFTFAYFLSTCTALGLNGVAAAYSIAPLVGISVMIWFLVTGRWKGKQKQSMA